MIEIRDIKKSYQMGEVTVEALRGIDLNIGSGEYVAILGPSGSGKSTLMQILGCLDTPTAGTYQLSGREVSGLKRNELAEIRNKQVGFIFQSFNLLAHASALENVALPLIYRGTSGRQRLQEAARLLERVGLADRMDHKP
ncbi:MAG: ATP-binding cassette domain-containing protein, partial [Candidatus Latescibacteria bacterium]|nr:ATP-binding cassette domain-containing protein [Candidatus Latescibacterota bacterium]